MAGERCYLPRVYLRRVTPEHPDLPAFKYEPSGSAVAFTRDAAVMTGFLEVIERDAASIWWQGRVVRRCVDLDTLDDENIQRFLDEQRSCQRRVWLLDVTSEFGIPVVILFVREGLKPPVFGVGCRPSKNQAAQAAALEAGQALQYAAQEQSRWQYDEGLRGEFFESGPDVVDWDRITDAAIEGTSIEFCRAMAEREGLAVLVHDLPSVSAGIVGVKVAVPGLCGLHQPALGSRMRRKVVSGEMQSAMATLTDHNPGPFPTWH